MHHLEVSTLILSFDHTYTRTKLEIRSEFVFLIQSLGDDQVISEYELNPSPVSILLLLGFWQLFIGK